MAAGRSAFDSDEGLGHPAAHAVDRLIGGPSGQDPASYWQAAGVASFLNQRSLWVDLGSDQTITAIQVRLALASPGWVTLDAHLLDSHSYQVGAVRLHDNLAIDGQAVGQSLPSAVPGVRLVFLTFTLSPSGVAPGLRTVGVYVQ